MSQPISHPDDQGPWLAAALFCDSLIDDPGGGRSLVRLHEGGEFFDEHKESAYGEPVIFLSFIGGKKIGRFRLEIIAWLPKKEPQRIASQEFVLDGPGSGHDIFSLMRIPADVEGIAWFDVVLDGRLMTRLAYRVHHAAQRRTG